MLALTSDFDGENRITNDIKEKLRLIAGAGFSHVHWCHEWDSNYIYSVYEMFQIKSWCDEFGLKVKGIHASAGRDKSDLKKYCSPNEYNRLAGVDLIKNRIDLAQILDAGAIVLHFYLPWQEFEKNIESRESFYCIALKSFDEMEGYCKTRKICICIENDLATPQKHTYFMFDTLFERYDKDYMGLCFDTGHALMICKENCLEYAERYIDRLFMIHIHDNQGEHDEHLIPFEGRFDWENFARVLANSPYEFPILLESAFRNRGDRAEWLKKAFIEGNRFAEMVSAE